MSILFLSFFSTGLCVLSNLFVCVCSPLCAGSHNRLTLLLFASFNPTTIATYLLYYLIIVVVRCCCAYCVLFYFYFSSNSLSFEKKKNKKQKQTKNCPPSVQLAFGDGAIAANRPGSWGHCQIDAATRRRCSRSRRINSSRRVSAGRRAIRRGIDVVRRDTRVGSSSASRRRQSSSVQTRWVASAVAYRSRSFSTGTDRFVYKLNDHLSGIKILFQLEKQNNKTKNEIFKNTGGKSQCESDGKRDRGCHKRH